MSIEKQIEEMAKAVCVNCTSEVCASGRCAYQYDCPLSMETIKKLHLKGYRLATDVAAEIFAEIDLIFRKQFEKCSQNTELKLLEHLCQAERFVINELWHEVAELKNKYSGEGK